MQSPRVQPFGVGLASIACFIGIMRLRCTGTSSDEATTPIHTGLEPPAGPPSSRTRAASLLGHLEAMWPGRPHSKHLRSLLAIFGSLHSWLVCPFFKQFGHVTSLLSRGGCSRRGFLGPSRVRCPNCAFRLTNAWSCSSDIIPTACSSSSVSSRSSRSPSRRCARAALLRPASALVNQLVRSRIHFLRTSGLPSNLSNSHKAWSLTLMGMSLMMAPTCRCFDRLVPPASR